MYLNIKHKLLKLIKLYRKSIINIDIKRSTRILKDINNYQKVLTRVVSKEKDMAAYPNEKWKDISGFVGKYQVSNFGRIRNVHPTHGEGPDGIRKLQIDRDGYLRITLNWTENKHRYEKFFYIHRLVAKAFVPNPHHYTLVNHKNEIKNDDRASNLEWCDCQYNNSYGNRNKKISDMSKHYIKLVKNGKSYSFKSMNSAVRWLKNSRNLKVSHYRLLALIRRACRNEIGSVYGYQICYVPYQKVKQESLL